MAMIIQETVIGPIGIEEVQGQITQLFFGDQAAQVGSSTKSSTLLLTRALQQLDEYLSGRRQTFDLPLAPQGTPFQQSVWRALCAIPYGYTASYKQVASAIGNPKAMRAVGMANNRNPIAIFIPCHRVIGADGSLVGFGGGLDIKRALLALEKKHVQDT